MFIYECCVTTVECVRSNRCVCKSRNISYDRTCDDRMRIIFFLNSFEMSVLSIPFEQVRVKFSSLRLFQVDKPCIEYIIRYRSYLTASSLS